MGFNNQVRKALDRELTLPQRFVAVRSAVQFFSPNGFAATFANLEKAIGTDGDGDWSSEQIEAAVELLRESRAHYEHHRGLWHQNRKRLKAGGYRQVTGDELTAFGDASWCDPISSNPKPRDRWVGLAEWAHANEVAVGPFGPELRDEVHVVQAVMPPSTHEMRISMTAQYGPFPSLSEPATVIEIPYRIFNEPIPDADYSALSERARLVADCWYSRSHDGHVRQQCLARLVAAEEHWVIPYVVAALGDYVIEIVQDVEHGLRQVWNSSRAHLHRYRQFAAHNRDFVDVVHSRATNYRYCYHTTYSRRAEDGRPIYPAFPALARLDGPSGASHRYRGPATASLPTVLP